MNNIVKLPDQDKCYDEAGDWVVKFDRGFSEAEEAEFQAWLCQSQQNYDVFMTMAKRWDKMSDLSLLSNLFPEEPEKVSDKRFGNSMPMAMAASFATALCALAILMAISVFDTTVEKVYETSVGEHSTVNLPDGSQLILNTNSLVKVDYAQGYRLLTLERGEIHIDVAHDPSRPLSVQAGENVIQAVGTAFNIELYENNRFELIVTDGEVRIGDRELFKDQLFSSTKSIWSAADELAIVRLPEQALAISEGQKMMFGVPDQAPVKLEEFEIEANLSWRQGNIIFNGHTLEDAIEEIGRYTSTRFEFVDEDLKQVRVAGSFRAGDISGLLNSLDETFNISSKRLGKEEIQLFRKL